ncbi:helix-turn-helix domain-containing protein [Streptomyces halobius]|uniref:Pyridoxamine 5'-phosphate oxidase family protein n=1 Tax=Streptomyces halobius TaxID=2879846 RepID=A0ABY4MIE1_9ACTN|nr:pyridoxamine 5'-phosphate oxidase family protein [Streptomyces halobius]UQA97007.1 pyridoxamine 5'-phosphate oxidase family protein [Streptomyces halobius]
MTSHETGSGPASAPDYGDLGRRTAMRRAQLGLSRTEVAARAGAATGYLQYVEEHSATPSIGFLLRLADALDTTVAELIGGTAELPPGFDRAGSHPEMRELGTAECRERLSSHGVGRVAVTVDGVPAVFPVNYTVVGDLVGYRAFPGSGPAAAAGHEAALEVDHIDDAFRQGWSVLVMGPAHVVTDLDESLTLEEHAFTAPWAGSGRQEWIVIRPTQITGRRIEVPG